MEDVTIDVARVHKVEGNSSLKAFADIVIGGSFLIKGMKIVEGKNGLFVSMPSELGKDGKWYNNVMPITREAREALSETLMEAYEV